jgi:hypothetical protein
MAGPRRFPATEFQRTVISPVSRNIQEVFPLPNFSPPTLQAANFHQLFIGTTGFTLQHVRCAQRFPTSVSGRNQFAPDLRINGPWLKKNGIGAVET